MGINEQYPVIPGYKFSDGRCGVVHAQCDPVKLCIFIGINVGGAVGWSLGEMVGTMTALLASGVGGILGVYVGWRVAMKYLN